MTHAGEVGAKRRASKIVKRSLLGFIGGDGDGSGTGGNGMLLLDHGLIAGNGSLIVGSEGNGTMVSHGGTAQVLMLIGELGGQGSLIVDGTTNLLTVKCAADASDAQLLVTGSGTQCAITNLYLGQHPDGTATMSVDPGATLTSSQLIVSSAGVGELSVEGTCIVNTLLRLRSTSTGFGSSALVDVHGRNALLNAGSIDLGPGSNGHLLVRNGGTVQSIVLTSQTNGTSVVEVGAAGDFVPGAPQRFAEPLVAKDKAAASVFVEDVDRGGLDQGPVGGSGHDEARRDRKARLREAGEVGALAAGVGKGCRRRVETEDETRVHITHPAMLRRPL